jgi:hypothetical protein
MFEIMRQARVFLAQHRELIPLRHVEEVLAYGSVEMYVVAGGTDIHTPEGNSTLSFEMAVYLLCLELCNMGLGNRPYQPHPFLHDPIIIEEPEEVAGGVEAAAEQPFADNLGNGAPLQVATAQPPAAVGDGVQIQGPFIGPGPLPPPPPLVPAPAIPQLVQPLHWVFGEILPEPKAKPNQGPGEYIEPSDEEPGHHMGAN